MFYRSFRLEPLWRRSPPPPQLNPRFASPLRQISPWTLDLLEGDHGPSAHPTLDPPALHTQITICANLAWALLSWAVALLFSRTKLGEQSGDCRGRLSAQTDVHPAARGAGIVNRRENASVDVCVIRNNTCSWSCCEWNQGKFATPATRAAAERPDTCAFGSPELHEPWMWKTKWPMQLIDTHWTLMDARRCLKLHRVSCCLYERCHRSTSWLGHHIHWRRLQKYCPTEQNIPLRSLRSISCTEPHTYHWHGSQKHKPIPRLQASADCDETVWAVSHKTQRQTQQKNRSDPLTMLLSDRSLDLDLQHHQSDHNVLQLRTIWLCSVHEDCHGDLVLQCSDLLDNLLSNVQDSSSVLCSVAGAATPMWCHTQLQKTSHLHHSGVFVCSVHQCSVCELQLLQQYLPGPGAVPVQTHRGHC